MLSGIPGPLLQVGAGIFGKRNLVDSPCMRKVLLEPTRGIVSGLCLGSRSFHCISTERVNVAAILFKGTPLFQPGTSWPAVCATSRAPEFFSSFQKLVYLFFRSQKFWVKTTRNGHRRVSAWNHFLLSNLRGSFLASLKTKVYFLQGKLGLARPSMTISHSLLANTT